MNILEQELLEKALQSELTKINIELERNEKYKNRMLMEKKKLKQYLKTLLEYLENYRESPLSSEELRERAYFAKENIKNYKF
tara:strand:+ start:154 stop:399 length:246 start_codon:yes stop_codon:yes gene_type:complete